MERVLDRFLLVFLFVSTVFLAASASAYEIDGDVSDWGIDLYQSGADLKGYLDTNSPTGGLDIDYWTEDNADRTTGFFQVNPGYSQGNQYDAEAIYFDNDSTYGYIAIITGTSINEYFGPGDIAIDFGPGGEYGYEYGIDIREKKLYYVNDWENVLYSQHSVSDPFAISNGAFKNDVDLIYSSTAVNEHYVIETSFLLSDLGLEPGDVLGLHWTMRCGNDEVNVVADVNPVPEPATMFLLGAGLIGLTGLRKKFKKVK